MVFKLVCLYLAVTCVFAAPPTDVVPLERQQPTVIPIVSQSEEFEANGTYKYSYETANGIKREETSYDKVLPKDQSRSSSNEAGEESDESNEIHVQQGSYSYTAPDGTLISVRYIADENGFRPIGDHLPKSPSVTPPSSGRRAKTLDTTGGSSAPEPALAKPAESGPEEPKITEASESPQTSEVSNPPAALNTPKTPQVPSAPEIPSIESRLGETSAEHGSTIESSDSSSTTDGSATELPSTEESASSTTKQDTTLSEVPTTEAQSSNTGESSTPEPTTSEASTTEVPTTESSTTEAPTTEISTSEASTPEPSTPDALITEASTPDASTPEASAPDASTTEAPTTEPSTPEVSSEAPTSQESSTSTSVEITTQELSSAPVEEGSTPVTSPEDNSGAPQPPTTLPE